MPSSTVHLSSLFLIVVVVVVAHLSTLTKGDESCKTSKIVKRHMNGLYQCGKSLKFKDEHDKELKMTCVLKCVLVQEGILTKDGKAEKDLLAKYLDREAPAHMKTKSMELFGACIDEHGPAVNPSDEFCTTYDPLVKCFVWASIQVFVNEFV